MKEKCAFLLAKKCAFIVAEICTSLFAKKCTLLFSVYTWAILQDFFAKTMLITLVNALVSDIEPRCKRKILSKKSTKRRQPIINRTYAISQLKNIIRKTAYSLKDLFNYLKEFIDRISRQLEYSRKGQSVTRKFKPLIKHAMAYKAI